MSVGTAAETSQQISDPPGFTLPSQIHVEHSLKATTKNHPVNADNSEEKVCQTNECLSALHYVFHYNPI